MGARTVTKFTGTVNGTVGSFITAFSTVASALGWTTLFSGSNKLVMANASGFVIRIVDDGSLAAGAREAIFRGGENATDIDTLVNPFPLVGTVANSNCVIRKSDTADTTARNYIAVGDDEYIVFAIKFGSTSSDVCRFGMIDTPRSADPYACVVGPRGVGNSSVPGFGIGGQDKAMTPSFNVLNDTALAFARSLSGLTLATRACLMLTVGNTHLGCSVSNVVQYPGDAIELDMQPIRIYDAGVASGSAPSINGRMRGHIPFEFEPMHGLTMAGIANYDTFSDTDYDPAAEFTLVSASDTVSSHVPRTVLQTAGTWDGGL
jgi:hypothetical protein